MVVFCIGVLVGFAIAALVHAGKDADDEMGCADEVQGE